VEADACGQYLSVHCDGQPVQQAPVCPGSCAGDDECDPGAHCDGECAPDLDLGKSCDENSDCAGDLCHNGRCCVEACGTQGCLTGQCGDDGQCTKYTSGHHNCQACQACDPNGQCVAQTAIGAAATTLGCIAGAEGCRRCDNGACTFFTSGQQSCPANHVCDPQGACKENQPQYQDVCFDPYPEKLGHWVSEWCPSGYTLVYHVCGAYGGINSYSWGPYYHDAQFLHSGGQTWCSCCCDCNAVCVRCKK